MCALLCAPLSACSGNSSDAGKAGRAASAGASESTPAQRARYHYPTEAAACYGREACEARCDETDQPSCVRLAQYLYEGWGGPEDVARARDLLDAACTAGDPDGCRFFAIDQVGWSSALRPDQSDAARRAAHARAIELHRAACEAGHGERCLQLARLEMLASGVQIHEFDFEPLSEKGCARGSADACELLGIENKQDSFHRRARTLRSKRCEAGDAEACRALSITELGSTAGARARARGFELYTAQCRAGYPRACAEAEKLAPRDTAHATADAGPAVDVEALVDRLFPTGSPSIPAAFGAVRPWMSLADVEKLPKDSRPFGECRAFGCKKVAAPELLGASIFAYVAKGWGPGVISELAIATGVSGLIPALTTRWGQPLVGTGLSKNHCWFEINTKLRVCVTDEGRAPGLLKLSAVTALDDTLGTKGDRLGLEPRRGYLGMSKTKVLKAHPHARENGETLSVAMPATECNPSGAADTLSFWFDDRQRVRAIIVEISCGENNPKPTAATRARMQARAKHIDAAKDRTAAVSEDAIHTLELRIERSR